MDTLENVINASHAIEAMPSTPAPSAATPINQFCTYWPMIRAILNLAKHILGPKGKAEVDKIIGWGNSICAGQ